MNDDKILSELKRIGDLLAEIEIHQRNEILDFVNWYNDHYPENYITTSKIGNYLVEKSHNKTL